ncbi:alpha/beta hydrolase [Kordiimonas aquimaris]|uniref:alpha/beta hydrolase n=1 Tax=Kordiimonas aquimaris TaxID=707591 RepID=UPI0021D3E9B6|nr:dienelactone hydrolase family protein [Kordiimonas aquimaris]
MLSNMLRTLVAIIIICAASSTTFAQGEERVVIDSDGWKIIGDLHIPESSSPPPVVILLHTMWRGNRRVYDDLAVTLGEAGIASLRIDLRGHGESINKRKLPYGEVDNELVFDAWPDVNAARKFLHNRTDVNTENLGIIAASYSGNLASKAGVVDGFASFYVILASGIISPESMIRMQMAEVPLLFVWAEDDHTWAPKAAAFLKMRKYGEIWTYPEGGHATALLTSQPTLPDRLITWISGQVSR